MPSNNDNLAARLPTDFEEFSEAIRDRTNDKFDEAMRRQKIIDSMKKEKAALKGAWWNGQAGQLPADGLQS